MGCLSRVPGQNFSILAPRSRVKNIPFAGSASENLCIFYPKIVSKLSEIWSGMFIPDGVKKAWDPGTATLTRLLSSLITEQLRNQHVFLERSTATSKNCFVMQPLQNPLLWSKLIGYLFNPISKRDPPRRIAVRPSSSSALSLSSTGSGMSSPFRRIHSLFPTSTYIKVAIKGLSGEIISHHIW